MDTVSVVIPAYNGARYVEGCLRNLRAQTYGDLEVIFVVDAKTTDGTADEVVRAADGWDRVRVVIQDDGLRMGGARNIGLREAGGRYVWFLDIDDTPYPSLLEEMIGLMESHGVRVGVFNSVLSADRDLPEKAYGEYRVIEMSGMDAAMEVGKGRFSSCPWCKVFETSFLRDNGLEFIPGYCEDFDQTVRAFIRADRVVYYTKPLYVYYQHAGSLCGGSNDDAIAERDVDLSAGLAEEVLRTHPESHDLFCAYMARHIIRSLTRASKGKAKELASRPEVRDLLSHRQPSFSAEVLLFRISPSLYCSIGRRARDRKYSMDRDVLMDPDLRRRLSASTAPMVLRTDSVES